MSSEPSKVFFGSIQQGKMAEFASLGPKVDRIVELLDFSTIKAGDKVAIKMHLGYNSGYQTIPVYFVRQIVKAVQRTGGHPFITDNPTSVYNAVERGYTQETCGCPLIPVAGVKDKYTYETKVDFKGVESFDMGGVLHDADVLIDLSHAKGHGACGYGGAIKNLSLGGYSGPTRWNKIHQIPFQAQRWDSNKCTPEHAEELAKSCGYEAIKYDRVKHKLIIQLDECIQCMDCLEADRDVGCLEINQEVFSLFQETLAVAAKQVLDRFDKNKRFFLNFILQVTPYCDCYGMAQPVIVPEVGVVGSRDIVAIEVATLDLIAKAGLIEKSIPPHFKHVNLDSNADLHPFQRIHGAMKNPYLVTEFAEKLGMGNRKYDLVEVLSPEETMKMETPKTKIERQPTFF
jgi:hypothetical protein